ncbi:hypothetical protein [Nocardia bovistercoris]|uniref:Uncharacterized protein n=1 Tax=Nocardia bovistercoris TaxID=2785916 RepID=A0A931I8N0_9NOCA|nr:hypothetical protein [Nocardia bovistercoris]MBH0775933.1 hypothetical protein [Nocardia bovistercoris]
MTHESEPSAPSDAIHRTEADAVRTPVAGASAAKDLPATGAAHTELIPALRQPVEEVTTLPLFDEPTLDLLRTRWRELQGSFVDSPRDAVTRADDLVAELIHQLTAAYAERKDALVEGWPEGSDTEALRHALRSYRAFFNQLLSPTG